MKIFAEQDWQGQWCAIDLDTYDGAEDSKNRNQIGYGKTEAEAVADLTKILASEAAFEAFMDGVPERDPKIVDYAYKTRK